MQKADYQSFLNRNQTKVQELYSWETSTENIWDFLKEFMKKAIRSFCCRKQPIRY